ncbi:MAG: hypothetical protein AABX82_07050, partial [Nanoarchaeota archaeon]
MRYPTIDAHVRRDLEEHLERSKGTKDYYGGFVSICSYGFDAVATVVFMRQAHSLQRRRLMDFLKKYDVIIEGKQYGESYEIRDSISKELISKSKGLLISRKSVGKDGVSVVPYHRDHVWLIDEDQSN